MTLRGSIRIAMAAGAAALLALSSHGANAGTCEDDAARNLLAASYTDSVLHPPDAEDRELLYKDSGYPNILVLFDSSSSMRRLPPNGPAFVGGSNPSLPPGVFLADPTQNAQQTTALAAARVVGCGIDPVSQAEAGFLTSDWYLGMELRRFNTPCGKAVTSSVLGTAYQGQATDYAAQMTVCPHFTPSDNLATGAAGFDPDYYDSGSDTAVTTNGKPNFFGRSLVFHDSVAVGSTYDYSATAPFRHNFGDGWTATDVYPYKTGSNTRASIATFCAAQGASLQGTLTRSQICTTCLNDKGWFYDGILLDDTIDGVAAKRYPSVWYTGNYLNFFPPKFLIARKVVKDVISVQSTVRMALARFDADGAEVFQDFNPSCGQPENSNFDSNRSSYISNLDSTNNLPFDGGAPVSRALFDIGQYYHSASLPWFGNPWELAANEVLPQAADNKNQYSICSSCQASSVIFLSGGVPNVGDGSTGTNIQRLPAGTTTTGQIGGYAGDTATGILGITSEVCPRCDDFSGAEDYLNNLPKVAWYLQNMDLRKDDELTLDCEKMPGDQKIQTHVVGFGTSQLPNVNRMLRNAAASGGGMFVGAENPSQLRESLNFLLREISTRSTSLSVASVTSLQTTSGRAVIVPRFDPNKSAHWEGHLYRFDLYSEFVNACTPGGAGDLDCDDKCVSAFLADDAGSYGTVSLISEDDSRDGIFVRNDPSGEPTCKAAPSCGTSCATTTTGSATAVPFWDAGEALKDQSWKDRNVWTVVDDAGGVKDGKIDASDDAFQLTPSNEAATKLVPYLGLGTSPAGVSVCAQVASLLSNAGDAVSASLVSSSHVECAKTIIRFLLGADVLNEKAKKFPEWPPGAVGSTTATQDDLWDRSYKLGDIFHSSPVVVDPPFPRNGVLCPAGLANQCISSLWGTPTPNGDAGYDAYVKSTYENRRKIVLVGANDGLLHAFDGGAWNGNSTPGVHNASADDDYTTNLDESLPPFNGYYGRGTASELWAFLPPDLISKIPSLMGSQHHFFVDGTAMVRDVWVDGTGNAVSAAVTSNDKKEAGEFHTVAVVGERRGGTRYFALDVTDATESSTHPKFLWMYPQPNDTESLAFGETYDDFLPTPPPIGPVRIAAGAGDTSTNTPKISVPGTDGPVAYHERWVAFLSGGFDPQYLRGRGVHMVDVWTGVELFDFSYPGNPSAAEGDPRLALRFPIAAPVGMIPWGRNAKRAQNETNDRFFDTATFGDTGGQLWVVRFNAPGTLGADGKVDNWHGARVFQMGGAQSCRFCGGQPFFQVTANMPLPSNLALRVFAGTGDRYNLLDTYGGKCGPDNIRACVMRGCSVTLDTATNFLEATDLGYAKRGFSHGACSSGTLTTPAPEDGASATCTAGGSVDVSIDSCPDSLTTTKDVQVSCTEESDGYRCESAGHQGTKLDISDVDHPIDVGNWYMSLLVFEDTGNRRAIFTGLSGAETYDAARLWISQSGSTPTATSDLVLMAASEDTPSQVATALSPGWAIHYDHDGAVTIGTYTFEVSWKDERTTAGTAAGEGLITWGTTQPTVGETTSTVQGCRASKCKVGGKRVGYHYAADPETGAPFGGFLSGGSVVRAMADYLTVPSQADQTTVFVNQKGQVAIGLTSVNPEKGATIVGMGEPIDPTTDLGVVEVGRELHACRHSSQPVCK